MRCELHDCEMVPYSTTKYPRRWVCEQCLKAHGTALLLAGEDVTFDDGPEHCDGPESEGFAPGFPERCGVIEAEGLNINVSLENGVETEGYKPANPKQAYGDNKVPLQLVPPVVEIYAALALGEGGDKYGPYNYRDIPVEMMTYIGAIRRHLAALLDGEYMDPGYWQDDTWYPPKPHLAGIIASAGIIADCWENGTIIDNRPRKGRANELLKKYQRSDRPGPVSAPDPRDEVPAPGEGVQGDSDVGERGSGPPCYRPDPDFKKRG